MHEWEGDERKDGLLRYRKNKDNKSADHEGMTQLIAEKGMRERRTDNGVDS